MGESRTERIKMNIKERYSPWTADEIEKRLIAAEPEMLAVLKCLKPMRSVVSNGMDGAKDYYEVCAYCGCDSVHYESCPFQQAQVAIAKAEGVK